MLALLTEAWEKAQSELAAAEIVLLEATAAASLLREEAAKLGAAVAALSGRPSAAPVQVAESSDEVDRRRKIRQKEKEASSPFANLKCSGCGSVGSMSEMYKQTSGSPIRMLVCTCGNQMI